MDQQEYERLLALSEQYCRRMVGIAGSDKSPAKRTAIAFAAMRARQCRAPVLDNLERLIEQFHGDDAEKRALTRLLSSADLPSVRRLSSRHTEEQLLAYILFCTADEPEDSRTQCISQGLSLLGAALLEAQPGQTYADVCCGTGGFLVHAFPALGQSTVAAFEPDRDAAAAALLRAAILGQTYRVLCRDILQQPSAARFDRIFLHPPLEEQKERVEYAGSPGSGDEAVPELSTMSQVWQYVGAVVQMLKPEGQALALVPASALGQVADRTIRGSYIRSGLVESVVLLPAGIVPGSDLACALVRFSHGNSTVRMVDARSMATRRGRDLFLDAGDIAQIAQNVGGSEDGAVVCSTEQLQEADWSLLPTRYLDETEIPFAQPLEAVASRIERGAQISTAKLEEMRSSEPTPYRYLRIADIEDGVVDAGASAEYLSRITDAAKNRCIQTGTLVLSRLGTPSYKSGVATVPEDEYVVAPGNVYLIDLDESMDPFFLQAFLQSEAGVASLRRLGGTSAVRPIALGDLRRMLVPVPPMHIQKKIAGEYRKASERCALLRTQLREAHEALCSVYDTAED